MKTKKLIMSGLLMGIALSFSGCDKLATLMDGDQAEQEPKKEEAKVVKIKPVEVDMAKKRTLEKWLNNSGEIMGSLEVDVYPEIAERLIQLKVDIGDKVKEGQVLAVLRKGTLLDSVTQARANLEASKIRLEAAKTDLQRTEKLYKGGLASDSQLTNARANVAASKAQLAQLEAMVRSSKTTADKITIVAPISGYVGNVIPDVGDMVSPQRPICTIVQFDKIKVRAMASDLDFPYLKVGLPTTISSKAAPGVVVDGKISRVSPMIDRVSRSITIEAVFDNKKHALRPGMLADIKVKLEEYPNILTIPNGITMERHADGRAIVYVVEGDKALRREIKVGYRDGDYVEVLEGLNGTEKIVVLGQHILHDGDTIKVIQDRSNSNV